MTRSAAMTAGPEGGSPEGVGRAPGHGEQPSSEGRRLSPRTANLELRLEPGAPRLTRSKGDRVALGLCGGVARFLDMPARPVRAACVVVTVLTLGVGAVAYVTLALLVPAERAAA